jgi:purine-binding chemotaxis protein CheW
MEEIGMSDKVEYIQQVTFKIDKETYGIDIHRVQEIIMMQEITQIPHAYNFVEGVLNLRGNVIPIVDLRKRLNFEPIEYGRNTRIVVVKIEDKIIGIIVDKVEEVTELSTDSIEPPPAMLSGIGREYLKGVGKRGDEIIILLDVDRIFSVEELETL